MRGFIVMILGLFSSLFGKNDSTPLVSVDIGTSNIKLAEVDVHVSPPRLVSVGIASTPAGAISNNQVVKPEAVATQIRAIMDAQDMKATRAVFGLPGPCAFSKKINLTVHSLKELRNVIFFEAANYIPHKIDAVRLDYQVLKNTGRSLEVLLVAVKNEIVQGYLNAVEAAGLEPVIADIDLYALENMFEVNYPEEREKTVAVIDVGARFSGVTILQGGQSLLSGDVSVGGKTYNEALCDELGLSPEASEEAKLRRSSTDCDSAALQRILEGVNEHLAGEFQRQLGLLWNAVGTERSIEEVYLCGGAAQSPGLLEKLSERIGLNCRFLETLRGIDVGDNFDRDYLSEIAPSIGVGIGLALRRPGDKVHAIQ